MLQHRYTRYRHRSHTHTAHTAHTAHTPTSNVESRVYHFVWSLFVWVSPSMCRSLARATCIVCLLMLCASRAASRTQHFSLQFDVAAIQSVSELITVELWVCIYRVSDFRLVSRRNSDYDEFASAWRCFWFRIRFSNSYHSSNCFYCSLMFLLLLLVVLLLVADVSVIGASYSAVFVSTELLFFGGGVWLSRTPRPLEKLLGEKGLRKTNKMQNSQLTSVRAACINGMSLSSAFVWILNLADCFINWTLTGDWWWPLSVRHTINSIELRASVSSLSFWITFSRRNVCVLQKDNGNDGCTRYDSLKRHKHNLANSQH